MSQIFSIFFTATVVYVFISMVIISVAALPLVIFDWFKRLFKSCK